MGFFSKILGGVVRIGRGLLGLPPAAAAAALPAGRTARQLLTSVPGFARRAAVATARQAPGLAIGAAGAIIARGAVDAQAGIDAQATLAAQRAAGAPLGRGNGQFVKQTIVQTIELMSGAVVREVVTQGDVFLFSKDVSKLRSTSKKLLSAAGKIPRRATKTSKGKLVTDAVQDAVLRSVTQSVACPK